MRLYLSALLYLLSTAGFSQEKIQPHFIVAADGSGNFKTVQEAFNAVPDLREKQTVIFVKKGIYKEKLYLNTTKINVRLIGENRDSTIITYDDYSQKLNIFGEGIGTSGSSSFFIYGHGFTAENLTIENSAGNVGQAVAVRIDGDRIKFINCRILGNQDTLYPHGEHSRQYYKNCYIEGTVDFIFGWSTAVFDSCTIFCKRNGYVTAASTLPEVAYGFVFRNCKITGSARANTYFLGRPWRPYAKVAYLHCFLDSVIRPEGWHNWDKIENEKTASYSEYKNYGPGAEISKRVTWSRQLTDEEASKYNLETIFGDWKP